jgi:hypothetical protein
MPGKMLPDLAFRFREERQVPSVAEGAGGRTHGKGAGVPERIEEARTPGQLGDALGAPGEMVLLLARRLLELLAGVLIARR